MLGHNQSRAIEGLLIPDPLRSQLYNDHLDYDSKVCKSPHPHLMTDLYLSRDPAI